MGADSAKNLLTEYNQKKYRYFTLNDDTEISLPAISSVPWIGLSNRRDVYKKIKLPQDKEHHLNFISKNDEPHAFIWETNPEKLKTAVRWGIVKTEAITAKVISALGKYRITAHQRIAKGMMSNTQALKLELLDLYQERFEALQELELLANKNNSKQDYEQAINRYIKKIQLISTQLEARFSGTALTNLHCKAIEQITSDLNEDIQRAEDYLDYINEKQTLRSVNRTRGYCSMLEFVKNQMSYNLYELQGINQDLSYSNKRDFALTRGEFNDYIEDARKEIDDYQADPRNAIRPTHQGSYGTEGNVKLSYDFSLDQLTPAREREVLLAISFIEGWDVVKDKHGETPSVTNESGSEPLTQIVATNWRTHRNFKALFQNVGYFLLNTLKSFVISTYPWEEETWSNEEKEFHLVAKSLRQHAKPNEPLWYKPYRFIKSLVDSIVDMIKGIRDIGSEFILELPEQILNDYRSTKELPSMKHTIDTADQEIGIIKDIERERLSYLLGAYNSDLKTSEPTSRLVQAEYHLSAGEWDDIVNSIVHGINGFSSLFTHGIYAKDPVSGLIFSLGYSMGAAVIFSPALSSAIFGSAYVNWFTSFSHSMGSSSVAAAIAGGSTQAQLLSSTWDLAMHGPKSGAATVVTQVLEDPLTLGTYFATAYGLGYVLANGVGGYAIPWVSEVLKEDLGSTPEVSYPILGGKIAILLYEAFQTHEPHPYHHTELRYNGKEQDLSHLRYYESNKRVIDRFCLALWLSQNSSTLPKLKAATRYNIERQINALFSVEEASSLKKIIYPEESHSIAHRLFSIPLSYIPAFSRLAIAPFIGMIAWLNENPNPWQPIADASKDLGKQMVKDLSRLIVATVGVVHLIYNVIASQVKAVVYTLNMLIGRLAGAFGEYPAHTMHKIFASIHVFLDKLGEIFYPARLIKSVVVAHPAHTVTEAEQSYQKLLLELVPDNSLLQRDEFIQEPDLSHFPSPLRRPHGDREAFVNEMVIEPEIEFGSQPLI